MYIIETADYTKMCVNEIQPLDECYDRFEELIQKNSEVNGKLEFKSFFNNAKQYAKLIQEFNLVKAWLTKLYFVNDDKGVAFLAKKGYKIDRTSSEAYVNSINAAMKRSDNILSKIQSKYVILEKAVTESKGSNKSQSFEALMANLTTSLPGVFITDDLSLERYNEYSKIIKQKIAKEKQHGRNKK